jgi:hypothetical protein
VIVELNFDVGLVDRDDGMVPEGIQEGVLIGATAESTVQRLNTIVAVLIRTLIRQLDPLSGIPFPSTRNTAKTRVVVNV